MSNRLKIAAPASTQHRRRRIPLVGVHTELQPSLVHGRRRRVRQVRAAGEVPARASRVVRDVGSVLRARRGSRRAAQDDARLHDGNARSGRDHDPRAGAGRRPEPVGHRAGDRDRRRRPGAHLSAAGERIAPRRAGVRLRRVGPVLVVRHRPGQLRPGRRGSAHRGRARPRADQRTRWPRAPERSAACCRHRGSGSRSAHGSRSCAGRCSVRFRRSWPACPSRLRAQSAAQVEPRLTA